MGGLSDGSERDPVAAVKLWEAKGAVGKASQAVTRVLTDSARRVCARRAAGGRDCG